MKTFKTGLSEFNISRAKAEIKLIPLLKTNRKSLEVLISKLTYSIDFEFLEALKAIWPA